MLMLEKHSAFFSNYFFAVVGVDYQVLPSVAAFLLVSGLIHSNKEELQTVMRRTYHLIPLFFGCTLCFSHSTNLTTPFEALAESI
jgi:hypothetical protein